MNAKETQREPAQFVLGALLVNIGLLVLLVVVYFRTHSQLVLAQGADSFFDLASGVVLAISAAVSRKPHDEDHPFGHQRAEPIGALITAVLAGVLAFEVLRSAVVELWTGTTVELDLPVAGILGLKFAIKLGLVALLWKRQRTERSSALRALFVDARNDMIATASSLLGWLLVREGLGWADAGLAVPVALYIGYSGFSLARENLRYLMGEAPDEKVHAELVRRAASHEGVLEVKRVRAQYLGQLLHVEVTILIADHLTATEAHDLALDVARLLEELDEVEEVFVHVDTHSSIDHT